MESCKYLLYAESSDMDVCRPFWQANELLAGMAVQENKYKKVTGKIKKKKLTECGREVKVLIVINFNSHNYPRSKEKHIKVAKCNILQGTHCGATVVQNHFVINHK